jgi:hypothetical protein
LHASQDDKYNEIMLDWRKKRIADFIIKAGPGGIRRQELVRYLTAEKNPDGSNNQYKMPTSTVNLHLRDLSNLGCIRGIESPEGVGKRLVWLTPEIAYAEQSKARKRFLEEMRLVQVDVRKERTKHIVHLTVLSVLINYSQKPQQRYETYFWDSVPASWKQMNTTVSLVETDGTKNILYNRDRLPEFYTGHEDLYEHRFFIDFPQEIKQGERISYMVEFDRRGTFTAYHYDKSSVRTVILDVLSRKSVKKGLTLHVSDPNTSIVWPSETRRGIWREVTELSTGKKTPALHWEVNYPPFGGKVEFEYVDPTR